MVEEAINASTESSSNINQICEPAVNLTRCDLEDIDNENENKFNEEVTEIVVCLKYLMKKKQIIKVLF